MDLFEYQGKQYFARFDIPELKQLGVSEVFTPGAPVQGIIDYIKQSVPV